jgi:hypothetical protein
VLCARLWGEGEFLLLTVDKVLGSPVNLKSGLAAVGALRREESNSQEPVALETTVIATGARPGDTAAKRQLFTEETQTVLVFEKGAVIRLSAAVADGQLLFLSNKTTGKEVVTQVLRKRAFRPTNCYVDLEFTEPCPGFWGIEFPKAGAASASAKTPAKLPADKDSDKPAKAAVPPSLQEVDRLKNEVAALQTQLKSLIAAGPNVATDSETPQGASSTSKISAALARKEEEKRLEELFAMEAKQEESHGPKRLVAYPRKSTKQDEKKSGDKKWMIAAGLVIALASGAGAAYRFGVFGGAASKARTNSAAGPVAAGSGAVGTQAPATVLGGTNDPSRNAEAAQPNMQAGAAQPSTPKNSAMVPDSSAATESEFDGGDPNVVVRPARPDSGRSAERSSQNSGSVAAGGVTSSKSRPAAALRNKPTSGGDSPVSTSGAGGSTAGEGSVPAGVPDGNGYVGPKLVYSVKSVTPTEALKNYVTGNVSVDALVDPTGHVKAVTVLSGPMKLRESAVKEMKQYIYEPARRHGKAVPAHVQLSLQYWYEP